MSVDKKRKEASAHFGRSRDVGKFPLEGRAKVSIALGVKVSGSRHAKEVYSAIVAHTVPC